MGRPALLLPFPDLDLDNDLTIPSVQDVHRWIDAEDSPYGRLQIIDYLDKFDVPPSPDQIAEAERQRNIRQYRPRNPSNARAESRKPVAKQPNESPTPRSGVPHLDEFLTVAGPQNPHKSTRELSQYWNETHGHVDPKTLPSLETFLPVMKEKNPDLSEHALTSYWQDRYGALGAPEKNNVAPSPGLLSTAKALGLKAAGAVTDLPKMIGQATAARTRP